MQLHPINQRLLLGVGGGEGESGEVMRGISVVRSETTCGQSLVHVKVLAGQWR